MAGFDQARLQHLLAYLALQRDQPISRQQLAFAFWPDTTDQQAFKNLRTLLTRLRQALPDADRLVFITAQVLQWRPDAPCTVDAADFEAAIARAAAAKERGEGDQAAQALAAAVAAYTGDLLPDCYDDWIIPLRERMHQAYGAALEQLVLALEERRDFSGAIPYAQHLLRHDPLHEAAYRHLMRLHMTQNDWTEALHIYRACTAMLKREFGAAPERATRDLHARLLKMRERAAAASTGSAGARSADPPLVDRRDEWSRLTAAWQAAAAGKPLIVLMSGEAGIGKTRLAEELCAWVELQGAATATARCYAGGDTLAYAPVVEWLNAAALRPRLAELEDAWRVEVGRLLPALLAERPRLTPPAPLTEAWQRTRLFEALARAILGTGPTGRDPLLLFLDDLQWTDPETIDWLVYLLHHNRGAPLLVVCTLRPHEVGEDHPWTVSRLALTRAGLLSEICLAPLDAVETAALAANTAGRAVDAAEAAQLYRDTEGNPLFVVEMVRAGFGRRGKESGEARERGRKGGGEQKSEQDEPLLPVSAAPALPPKVRAVIQWRLAMLSPGAQALAQTAAVIGRRFSYDVLCQASGQEEAAVMQGLDELWRRHLVRDQGDDTYDFSHDGVRAVAYEAIGPVLRRGAHLRVARALEALHSDHLDAASGQIAIHYAQAGETQPAITYYRRAAANAQRLYANSEAVRFYRHLLEGELAPSLSASERCQVILALAEVLRVIGHWARVRTITQEAIAIAESLGDVRLAAQAQRALADVLQLLGYYDEALEWLAKAEEGFLAAGEGRGMVSALWTMGQIYWLRGCQQQALAVLERQLQIATDMDDQRGICEALETMGMVYWSQGDWEQSADCCLRSIRIAEPLGHKLILTRASITLGNVRASQHWFGEAVHWYLRAGVLAQEIDDRQAISWATSNIALVLAKRGEYAQAAAGYERSLRNAIEIGDRWTACLNVAGLAAINERRGRLDLAESLYRKAIGFGGRLGIPSYLSGMLIGLARLLLARGRTAEAAGLYDEAWAKISSVAGERLAGEDTRFDALVLGIRLRLMMGKSTVAEAATAIRELLRHETAPHRQAALNCELWRLTADPTAQRSAATFYRTEHAETGAEECRSQHQDLTGETLLDPLPLPDISELIPDEPEGQDLVQLVAELESSFDS